MGFKVGDKVKFLNEEGGGIVSKIVSARMVNVSVEDGFDIPTLVSELVLIEPTTHAEKLFREDFNVAIPKQPVEELNDSEADQALIKINPSAKDARGVYLALVPQDQNFLITGNLDIYIVNHTDQDILYSILLKDENGRYLGFDYNSVSSESALLIDSPDREEIEEWREGLVQILYHNMTPGAAIMPANAVFKIKSSKLNNENAYPYSTLLNQKALLLSLNETLLQEKFGAMIDKDNESRPSTEKAKEKKEAPLIDRHQTLPKVAVVDLHIGELIDNVSGLESRDMFAIQKKYFKDCLESAILNQYKKVTFIHGVGNGVLKNAIIGILKDYETVENQSASISKFGLGAIDVLIRPWE